MIDQQQYPGKTPASLLFLVGDGVRSCGVGDFAYGAARACAVDAPSSVTILELGRDCGSIREIWTALSGVDAVVCNLPVVSWKRVLVRPLLALVLARLRGARTIVMLHEWAAVHWLRRFVLRPLLWTAQEVVMFSPLIRAEVMADAFVAPLLGRVTLAPLPPNIERPQTTHDTPLARTMVEAKAAGRLVLGSFGSIYPGKTPDALLEVAGELKRRGRAPLLVFAGSFIKASGDSVEEDFHSRVKALGLEGDVLVSGHVASHAALFGLFDATHVLVYAFAEGLTSRRGSVLVCAQAGRPVLVTAPQDMSDFDHHPRYRALLEDCTLIGVPREGGAVAYADAVEAALSRPVRPAAMKVGDWWADVARIVRSLV